MGTEASGEGEPLLLPLAVALGEDFLGEGGGDAPPVELLPEEAPPNGAALQAAAGPGPGGRRVVQIADLGEATQEGVQLCAPETPQAELLPTCQQLARDIMANGPYAVRLAKEVIDAGLQVDLASGLALEQKAFGLTFSTHDQKEGMKAFLEKRKALFRNG